jgi:hypothetical protein
MIGPGGFDVYLPKSSNAIIKGYGQVQTPTDKECAIACTNQNLKGPPT